MARRARWLERYRRWLALGAAIWITTVLADHATDLLGRDARSYAMLLAVTLGIAAWLIAEIGLAALTAVWETAHARVVRDGRLPRAIVLRKWRRRPAGRRRAA